MSETMKTAKPCKGDVAHALVRGVLSVFPCNSCAPYQRDLRSLVRGGQTVQLAKASALLAQKRSGSWSYSFLKNRLSTSLQP